MNLHKLFYTAETIDAIQAETKKSTNEEDFYSHDHMIEFYTNGVPSEKIDDCGGNVNLDKLLDLDNLSDFEDMEFYEVHAYKDGAIFEGTWKVDGWNLKKQEEE